MARPPSQRVRIGDWRVDPVAGQIRRGEEVVRLEARTMRLLLRLAEQPGEVVSIDTLLDEVWSGVTVTPDSVYQAVAALRRLLGDDPKQPRYIATVPRLGYRMTAQVAPWSDDAGATFEPALMQRRRRMGWRLVATFGLGLAAAALAYAVGRPLTAPAPPPSIGVLPFRDMTDTMDQEVMADDLTEDVVDALARTPGVRTPGPRSAFAFKGKSVTPAEAARTLGVAYVIDGSVRKAGAQVRVTARLVRADTGFVAWSQTYDRPMADLPTIQAAIAHEAAAAIRPAGPRR